MNKKQPKINKDLNDWLLFPLTVEEFEKRLEADEKRRESMKKYQKKKYKEMKDETDKS